MFRIDLNSFRETTFFHLHPKHLAYCSLLNSGNNLVETCKNYDLSKSVNEYKNIFAV